MSAADATIAFFDSIARSGLLDDEQLTELSHWIVETQADVQSLAKEVFRRRWLSQFQIKEIFKGRGQSLTLGPYVLLDLLGEGGMGRVYKAYHVRLERIVALKIIRKEKLTNPVATERFHTEIQAIAQMAHPNVVTAYDADQVGDVHFLVMEYIDGTDLTKIVKSRGPLPIPEACGYVYQAAIGLQHAFELGLVHRDIKPSNLLVTRETGVVKILDFGLARLAEASLSPGQQRVTQEGLVLGTPDFLAPEQARNPAGVDIRADIYALGGTLYYLLTASPPYEGATTTDKLLRHCNDPPPDARQKRPEVPEHLARLIQWFMAKLPEHRPQTPLELALALQPYCPPPGITVRPVPAPGAEAITNPSGTAYPPAPGAALPSSPSAYPQPQPLSGMPAPAAPPAVDPAPSSQIFKLPAEIAQEPIRERVSSQRSLVTPLLFLFGGVIVLGILAFAAWRVFQADEPSPLAKEFEHPVGMKFVLLPAGSFRMGSPEDEPGRREDEGPLRTVTLNAFYIAVTEVTQTQFMELVGRNPSAVGRVARGFDTPVENVSWEEAVEYCRRLTVRYNPREGWAFRLPTEAEWEYACRAGTQSPFWCGEKLHYPEQAMFTRGSEEDDPLADGIEETKPPTLPDRVASRPGRLNPWGLADMHGNVAEWCLDYYSPEYDASATNNPRGPADGSRNVIRGGSWKDPASACRSAARRSAPPRQRFTDVGIRVVYAPIAK